MLFVVAVEEASVKQLDRSMRTDFHQISFIDNYHSPLSSASALIVVVVLVAGCTLYICTYKSKYII